MTEDQSAQEKPLGRHWLIALPSDFGESLDWEASWAEVVLFVELPVWLMVPNWSYDVEVAGHNYRVDVVDNFGELFAYEVRDSRETSLYIGPMEIERVASEIREVLERDEVPWLWRKCKTVVRIHTRCNADVLAAAADKEDDRRAREGGFYLQGLCEVHLPIVHRLIQAYRWETYDLFPWEVSPWDLPVWYVHRPGAGSERVVLFDYATWDAKPLIGPRDEEGIPYRLAIPPELQSALGEEMTPGEEDLLDAFTLMERGDYSGAVRRITTAIEAVVEHVLRQELLARHSASEVERRLHASRTDFPGRVRQYQKLSSRTLDSVLEAELEATRQLRHEIVHRGRRILFQDRGQAQKAVDHGRWTFNWFEARPEREQVREDLIEMRSLGRHFSYFNAELTPDGPVVRRPPRMPDESGAKA